MAVTAISPAPPRERPTRGRAPKRMAQRDPDSSLEGDAHLWSGPGAPDSPVVPLIGVDLADDHVRARVLRKAKGLRGRKALYVESSQTGVGFVAWLSTSAPEIVAETMPSGDGRFRAVLYP